MVFKNRGSAASARPFVADFSTWSRAFFSDEFDYEQAAKDKFWKDPKVPDLLSKTAEALAALTEWNHDTCDHATRAVAEAVGVKAGLLINAIRVAIVGQPSRRRSSIQWSRSARSASCAVSAPHSRNLQPHKSCCREVLSGFLSTRVFESCRRFRFLGCVFSLPPFRIPIFR